MNLKVLMIEDERLLAEPTKDLLKKNKYSVDLTSMERKAYTLD